MRIVSLWSQRIWADGNHNAFPGVTRFGDHYYVAFRCAAGHQSPTAAIRVIRSPATDLQQWSEVACFDITGDSRDPFITVVNEQLHVYWHRSPADWLSQSTDGEAWSEPVELETEFPDLPPGCDLEFRSQRRWHFRVRPGPDDHYYSLARCGIATNGNAGILLYRSRDGRRWEALHSFGEGIQKAVPAGHEADLAFLTNGTAVAAIRARNHPGGGHGMIACAQPPYEDWDCYTAGVRNFGGPALLSTKHGLLLAARSYPADGLARCTLWEATPTGLVGEHIVPSAGDCGYQVMVEGPADEDEVLLCHYSQHELSWQRGPGIEQPAHIYLAHLCLKPHMPGWTRGSSAQGLR